MKESIGSTFLYNIMFLFILIVFALLSATLNYYKAYKVNTRILEAIRNASGYNGNSYKEIERVLSGIGYTAETVGIQRKCDETRGNMNLILGSRIKNGGDTKYRYCVYYNSNDSGSKDGDKKYYSYGVVTYIFIDLPIVGQFKVPVFTQGERIYKFEGSCQKGGDCD